MNVSEPVAAVVDFLKEQGYALWPGPVLVRGVQFSFDAVLQAPDRFSDVVLVCDVLAHDDQEDIVQQVIGLARALDMAGKANPLTTIVVGGRLDNDFVNRLMGVTRLLPLGDLESSSAVSKNLENGLAILTPLNVDPGGDDLADPVEALREAANNISEDMVWLVDLAETGQSSVQEAAIELMEGCLAPAWEDDE